MTDWISSQTPSGSPETLGPLQLAWLGDAVWEMHQRLRFCKKPARSKDLHQAVVSEVRACAQAEALLVLEPYLTQIEKDYVRRGRNSSGRGPKKVEAATYAMATGFETMIGWLFLKDPLRLAELFKRLNEMPSDNHPLNK
ncbi:Mini-ribonuclease 3 [Prochlorococcus sp. MIT 1223]|uniref:Mini-ribonuclease 3 n=1 Tax=Prochlorococcus sp. MIT 1223 TaxID=3096217 RepID=UPI002A75712B|nr:ribonuclease III domain-containing protein [Prochlorococcus sp. MIT 1223]